MANSSPVIPDPWTRLRQHTPARIALGRAGGSVPTAELLNFAMAHAAARDAVRAELDLDALEAAARPLGLPVLRLKSAARDAASYLLRPDLGRQLDQESACRLAEVELHTPVDIALVVSGGLSAMAAQSHAIPLLTALVPMLNGSGVKPGPISLVRFGRVAIQDEIGSILGARISLILLGERPGLASPDSLGAYLVYEPGSGRTDADRNCVSNIRPAGLPPDAAAATLHYLMIESLRRRLSGVALKDGRLDMDKAGRAISPTGAGTPLPARSLPG